MGLGKQPKIRLPPELGSLVTSAQRSAKQASCEVSLHAGPFQDGLRPGLQVARHWLERAHLREVSNPPKAVRTLEEMPVGSDKGAVQFNCQGEEGGVVKREVKLAA